MIKARAYAAFDAETPLDSFDFERRDVGTKDVQIEIKYCGVCHSDLHTARSEWPGTVYPCVPGHEMGSSRVDLQACKLEYSIVSPK